MKRDTTIKLSDASVRAYRQIEDAALEANPAQSLRTLSDNRIFLSVIYIVILISYIKHSTVHLK